jgi:hypothetical protein
LFKYKEIRFFVTFQEQSRTKERERDVHLVLNFGPVIILSGRDIDGGGVELAIADIMIPFGGPGRQIAGTPTDSPT